MVLYPYSTKLARESGSNFYPAFRFLPPEQRGAISVIYAFSRLLDDSVDQTLSVEQASREIELWRSRLVSLGVNRVAGNGQNHPIEPELGDVLKRFQIPQAYLQDLLKGVEMDLVKKRYETFEELEKYCYYVAGSVGLICNQIFNRGDDPHYAVALGTAFQLTNILRDLGEDLARDRIYLPLADMKKFGYSEADLRARLQNGAFLRLMEFEAGRAWGYFEATQPILKQKKIIAAYVMSRFYRSLLKKLEKNRFPVFTRQVALSSWEKGWLLLSCWADRP